MSSLHVPVVQLMLRSNFLNHLMINLEKVSMEYEVFTLECV
jgi:hypothetical protein